MDTENKNMEFCPLTGQPYYVFGTLQIHNPLSSHLAPWFNLVKDATGNICEFGVYKGASLVTTSLILDRIGNASAKVHGYDTFSGFPNLHEFDQPEMFKTLFQTGKITKLHYLDTQRVREMVQLLGRSTNTEALSSNTNFSDTNLELVQRKLAYFNLSTNVCRGKIEDLNLDLIPDNIEFVLIDLDLYSAYRSTLAKIWEKLQTGGIIYFDEYYSLKFPGPRFAVEEFCEVVNRVPTVLTYHLGFPRYILTK